MYSIYRQAKSLDIGHIGLGCNTALHKRKQVEDRDIFEFNNTSRCDSHHSSLPPTNEVCKVYVFTSVCQSFWPQGGRSTSGESASMGVCIEGRGSAFGGLHPGGVCIQGGLHPRGIGQTPPSIGY